MGSALLSPLIWGCKSEKIGSNYTDLDTDLEAEANINEEGNEDCSAIL